MGKKKHLIDISNILAKIFLIFFADWFEQGVQTKMNNYLTLFFLPALDVYCENNMHNDSYQGTAAMTIQ